jgi:type IV pilus assembly protein PilV
MMRIQRSAHPLPPSRKASAGVGLIEILVAVVILAFGLLGIAALQATALRTSQSAIERNEALVQSYAILDAMRANRNDALIGRYNLTFPTCAQPDDDGSLARKDLRNWIETVQSPDGLGGTACVGIAFEPGLDDTFRITIRWDNSRGNVTKTSQATEDKFETVSRL